MEKNYLAPLPISFWMCAHKSSSLSSIVASSSAQLFMQSTNITLLSSWSQMRKDTTPKGDLFNFERFFGLC